MTLITYPTRVHFADFVLEEALHSEMENAGLGTPLLLGPAPLDKSETCERIRDGLPRRGAGLSWGLPDGVALAAAAREVAALATGQASGQGVDVVIAFGSARAIALGRHLRRDLRDGSGARLPLYAVPGIDGLPDPCRPNLETWQGSLPTVLICDPTLTLGAGPDAALQSVMISLVRATEAYLADTYNPPADGMALDAFRRCLALLPRLGGEPDLDLLRDLMAAALNAALSLDKGIGPAQALTAALRRQHEAMEPAAAARLILPGALEAMGPDADKADALGRLMGGGWSVARLRDVLGQGLGARGAAAPTRLSELGLSRDHLAGAVAQAERSHLMPRGFGRAVLEAVW